MGRLNLTQLYTPSAYEHWFTGVVILDGGILWCGGLWIIVEVFYLYFKENVEHLFLSFTIILFRLFFYVEKKVNLKEKTANGV